MAKTSDSPIASMIRRLAEDYQTKTLSDQELLRRFSAGQDEVAFGSLLRRHGSMVLNVCRNVAASEEDAEDAFQATFIVLARKANSIRKMASAASWLHGVAYRTALNIRKTLTSRQKHEGRAGRARGQEAVEDLSWREAQHLIHAELSAIADNCRAPLVLCFLEGRTQDEAAKQLNISKTTLKKRLERGRALLRMRLLRRGLGPTAVLAAYSWPAATVSACLPRVLATATVKAATAFVSGQTTAGLVSGQVTILVASALSATATKLKIAMTVLLAIVLVPTLGGWAFYSQSAKDVSSKHAAAQIFQQSDNRNERSAEATRARKVQTSTLAPSAQAETNNDPVPDGKGVLYAGKVLAPDGQGIAGAMIYVNDSGGYHWEPNLKPHAAVSGPGGAFRFTLPKKGSDPHWLFVAAMAPKYGAALLIVNKDTKREELALQLVKDEVPIRGQVIDLEGKPVAQATLRVLQIHAAPGENIDAWLKAIEDKEGPENNRSWRLEQKYLQHNTALSPVAMTGADGRFTMTGIGPNRLVVLQLDGPSIASEYVRVLTRRGKAIEVPFLARQDVAFEEALDRLHVYYGTEFRHAAMPTRPIIGVVRDKDSGNPLPGVTVQSEKLATSTFYGTHIVKTKADDRGRYRLIGMPIGKGNIVSVVPQKEQPYFISDVPVPNAPGFESVTLDINLKRGIWITGTVVDKETGKPLTASLNYIAMAGNPNLKDYPGTIFSFWRGGVVEADAEGRYRVVGMPGPGVLGVLGVGRYLRANDRDDEFGVSEKGIKTETYILPVNYCALARINPAATDAEAAIPKITLDAGWSFTGTLVGPDGRPLTNKQRLGLSGWGWIQGPEKKISPFTATPYNPARGSEVVFRHEELGLVAMARSPKTKGGYVNMRLGPGAAISGRLVDAAGKARARVKLMVGAKHDLSKQDWQRQTIETDAAGRFQIKALIPNYESSISDDQSEVSIVPNLRPGETRELGDVVLQGRKGI